MKMLRHPAPPYLVGDFLGFAKANDGHGEHLIASGIAGDLLISW